MENYVIHEKEMNFVTKGWGYERWIYNENYCGKILFFNKDKKCSFHFHKLKEETLYCESGLFTMKFSEDDDFEKAKTVVIHPGMAFTVPINLRHQMIAHEDTVIYEFSTHHEDSDSYRIIKGD